MAEFERCGIAVDVSHLSDAGVRDVLEVATRPAMATHSSCRVLYPHARNLTDTQMAAVAETGGLVCINAFGGFLGERPSMSRYVDHIEHAVSRVGPAAVGICADFMDDLLPILDPILEGGLVDEIPVIPELRSARDYPGVAEALPRAVRDIRVPDADAAGRLGSMLWDGHPVIPQLLGNRLHGQGHLTIRGVLNDGLPDPLC